MNKPIKYVLITIGSIATVPVAVFSFLLFAYVLTLAQWLINGYDNIKPKTKIDLERHLFLETSRQYGAFTNLQYGLMHHLNENTGVYEGARREEDYIPKPGDKYFTYIILGVMPIDAVFDSNDNVITVFQTFDH